MNRVVSTFFCNAKVKSQLMHPFKFEFSVVYDYVSIVSCQITKRFDTNLTVQRLKLFIFLFYLRDFSHVYSKQQLIVYLFRIIFVFYKKNRWQKMSNPPRISGDTFHNLCRVCATKSAKTISLFGIRKKGLILADMLGICTQTNIRQTDIRPSYICNRCLSNLEIAFDFYNLVKSSENKFEIMLTTQQVEQKVEPIEFCTLNDDCLLIQKHLKVEFSEENAEILPNQQQTVNKKPTIDKPVINHSNINAIDEMDSYEQDMYNRKMNRLFECFLCKEKLKSFKDTRVHLKRHNEATPFKCKICTMNFSAAQFEQHLCKGQSVQCDYCFESFETTKSILTHLESHKDYHNLHKCTDCSKLFPMMYLLECHQHQHKLVEKKHICHICNRGFRVNFLLTKHLATHSDERRKRISANIFSKLNMKLNPFFYLKHTFAQHVEWDSKQWAHFGVT